MAVSGGADSVVLAHFLRQEPYTLVIGHVDHALRRGSSRDARFVKTLAAQWDIPYRLQKVNVKAYAKNKKLSLEEAARECRYQALARMARQNHCSAIVTAHTASDQAETVLMNFLRGSGPAGLAGMPTGRYLPYAGKTLIVRPFLEVTRSTIMTVVKEEKLPYREDPSNRSLHFTRNRIRHEVLPSLEKVFPGISSRLAQTTEIYQREEDYWQGLLSGHLRKTVRKKGRKITVVLPRLLRYHRSLSRRILRHILPGLSFQDIENILTLARSPERTEWLKFSGHRRVRRYKNTLEVV